MLVDCSCRWLLAVGLARCWLIGCWSCWPLAVGSVGWWPLVPPVVGCYPFGQRAEYLKNTRHTNVGMSGCRLARRGVAIFIDLTGRHDGFICLARVSLIQCS